MARKSIREWGDGCPEEAVENARAVGQLIGLSLTYLRRRCPLDGYRICQAGRGNVKLRVGVKVRCTYKVCTTARVYTIQHGIGLSTTHGIKRT